MAHKLNTRNLITIVSVTILVGAEILGVALAFGWAIGGLLELPPLWLNGLIGLSIALGAYGVWVFYRHAVRVEPIFDRP